MTTEERIKELGITLYQGRPEDDYAIAMWWDRVYQDKTIREFVTEGATSLSGFMGMFKDPNMLLYTTHAGNVEMAGWFEPISTSPHAVFFSSWCAPDFRGSRRQAMVMATIYEVAFKFKKVLIGITKHEELLELHYKIGYTDRGDIPFLMDEETAHILFLTRENFYDGQLFKTARKLSLKEK